MGIQYLKGDATKPIGNGQKAIVHVCNDIGAWGAGFVLAISKKWKQPEIQYRIWHNKKENFQLGNIQPVRATEDITVINMIAQNGIRSKYNQIPINYKAVRCCLEKVANYCIENNMTVHMPLIGCGLAGGKWEVIEQIINETLIVNNIDVYVYEL